jgi:hypothetical protein
VIDAAIIGLLALIAVLLFLCWSALRFIGDEVAAQAKVIRGFVGDYEELNDFERRKKLVAEVAVDRDFAEWQARQPKESK